MAIKAGLVRMGISPAKRQEWTISNAGQMPRVNRAGGAAGWTLLFNSLQTPGPENLSRVFAKIRELGKDTIRASSKLVAFSSDP
jgi:hypothetical protein